LVVRSDDVDDTELLKHRPLVQHLVEQRRVSFGDRHTEHVVIEYAEIPPAPGPNNLVNRAAAESATNRVVCLPEVIASFEPRLSPGVTPRGRRS
jgi:hypothetical protein